MGAIEDQIWPSNSLAFGLGIPYLALQSKYTCFEDLNIHVEQGLGIMPWEVIERAGRSVSDNDVDATKNVDSDGDGHTNYCEFKWDTNPRNPISFPGQGELCDPFEGQ